MTANSAFFLKNRLQNSCSKAMLTVLRVYRLSVCVNDAQCFLLARVAFSVIEQIAQHMAEIVQHMRRWM